MLSKERSTYLLIENYPALFWCRTEYLSKEFRQLKIPVLFCAALLTPMLYVFGGNRWRQCSSARSTRRWHTPTRVANNRMILTETEDSQEINRITCRVNSFILHLHRGKFYSVDYHGNSVALARGALCVIAVWIRVVEDGSWQCM